jgi:hypothetical protein
MWTKWFKFKRKIRRTLYWTFGRKYYFVISSNVVKVVILEHTGKHVTCLTKDANGEFNHFGCNEKSIHRTKDDAIKALIEIHHYKVREIEKYWDRVTEKLGWER